MEIVFWIIILAVSLAILFKSSDYFIDGAERLGLYFKIQPFIIGVFVLGFGTSIPELVVGLTSAFEGNTEIIIGNVLGANITNIFLVLGIVAVIVKESKINFNFLKFDLPLLLTSTFLLAITIWDGIFSAADGIFFLAIFVTYIIYIVNNQQKAQQIILEELKEIKEEKEKPVPKSFRHNLKNLSLKIYHLAQKKVGWINWLTVAKIVVSPFFIYVGAKYTVEAIINLSQFFRVGSEIIAASVIALGTTLPELSVSYATLKRGKVDEMLGNIIGSGIFNILLVMSIPALISEIVIPQTMITTALPIMLIATVLLFVVAYDKKITRWEGIILLIFYIFYLGLIFNIL